jgi:hypothetical protein
MSQPSHKVQQKRNYVYRFNRLSENIRVGKVSGSELLRLEFETRMMILIREGIKG